MKIIINRGFEKRTSKIVVFKNTHTIGDFPTHFDHLELDAQEGDKIEIRMNSFGMPDTTIASFVFTREHGTYYICPNTMYSRWEIANYRYLPYLCLLSLAFRYVIEVEWYDYFCACLFLITPLSLMSFQICMAIPSIVKRFFKLTY